MKNNLLIIIALVNFLSYAMENDNNPSSYSNKPNSISTSFIGENEVYTDDYGQLDLEIVNQLEDIEKEYQKIDSSFADTQLRPTNVAKRTIGKRKIMERDDEVEAVEHRLNEDSEMENICSLLHKISLENNRNLQKEELEKVLTKYNQPDELIICDLEVNQPKQKKIKKFALSLKKSINLLSRENIISLFLMACEFGEPEIVENILDRNEEAKEDNIIVKQVIAKGFILAIENSKIKVLEILLNHLKNFDRQIQKEIVNFRREDQNRPLHIAVSLDASNIINLILEYLINNFPEDEIVEIINTESNCCGTPLIKCMDTYEGDNVLVTFLQFFKRLKQSNQQKIFDKEHSLHRFTALEGAITAKQTEMIKKMIYHMKENGITFDENNTKLLAETYLNPSQVSDIFDHLQYL